MGIIRLLRGFRCSCRMPLTVGDRLILISLSIAFYRLILGVFTAATAVFVPFFVCFCCTDCAVRLFFEPLFRFECCPNVVSKHVINNRKDKKSRFIYMFVNLRRISSTLTFVYLSDGVVMVSQSLASLKPSISKVALNVFFCLVASVSIVSSWRAGNFFDPNG